MADARSMTEVASPLSPGAVLPQDATRWADALGDAGVDVVMIERVRSHGDAFWSEEFPLMVVGAFGPSAWRRERRACERWPYSVRGCRRTLIVVAGGGRFFCGPADLCSRVALSGPLPTACVCAQEDLLERLFRVSLTADSRLHCGRISTSGSDGRSPDRPAASRSPVRHAGEPRAAAGRGGGGVRGDRRLPDDHRPRPTTSRSGSILPGRRSSLTR
jgi:hypothetical protein